MKASIIQLDHGINNDPREWKKENSHEPREDLFSFTYTVVYRPLTLTPE
jgi:hypothetical protein